MFRVASMFRVARRLFDFTIGGLNRSTIKEINKKVGYEAFIGVSWVRRLANFFGMRAGYFGSFFGNLFPLMTFWHHDQSPLWQKLINWSIIKPLLFAVLDILALPFRFALNVVKLALVFLPLLIVEALKPLFDFLWKMTDHPGLSWPIRALACLGAAIVGLIIAPLAVVGYVSHALLAPVQIVKELWESENPLAKVSAIPVAVFIATAYMALFPMAVYVLGPILLAKAAAILPTVVTNGINAVISAAGVVGNAIAPVCQFLGSHLFTSLSAPLGLTAAQAGFGQLIGLAALAVGSAFQVVRERAVRWYNSFGLKEKEPRDDFADDGLTEDDFESSYKSIGRRMPPGSRQEPVLRYHNNGGTLGDVVPAIPESVFDRAEDVVLDEEASDLSPGYTS